MLALIYDLSADYLERRGEFRDEHLAMITLAHERGELQQAGAFSEPFDQSLLVWSTNDVAVVERFVAADPYIANGLVTSWRIRNWNVVIEQ